MKKRLKIYILPPPPLLLQSKLGYNLSNSVGICLYKKALSISMLSNKNYKTGDLVNLLSVDAMRLL
jgi:ATP-binding cassette subfamily C (CFTR/MRP) protein 2